MKYIQNYLLKISVSILFLFTSLLAETPDFIWANQFGSIGNEYARKITRDRSGNYYIAGEYHNAFDFGGTLLKYKDSREIFLAKLEADGDLLWVKSIVGSENQSVADITCDSYGNCFLIGGTNWTIYFDTDSLPCWNDHGDVFVLKFNSAGKLEWSMKGHGAEIAKINACATDENGNCYITGGGELIHFKNKSIVGPYLVKISGDGNSEWARSVRSFNSPVDIAVDGYANCYLIANRYEDVAIFKYNAQGDTIWTRTLKGGGITLRSIACDFGGNTVITGSFESKVTIGNTTLNSKAKSDMFVAKMDSKGNFLWAKSSGGAGTDKGLGISMDKFNNIFVTGYMAGNATFDETTLPNPQGTDLFVACYDKDGNLQWVKNSTGT
ncbi:hypothetical protein JW964_26855, partial [candidate division KSB1 bacterium]|nr:hypothetical protein [candidate division KSB1 bacterium]